MAAYLAAAAGFNSNTFPYSPYDTFDVAKFNAASMKPKANRTEDEQRLIDLRDKFLYREIYQGPVAYFVADRAEANTFQYVGSGVRVGQADRIVCWYRPRNATNYRVLYGDLSIRDVAEKDLPFGPTR